MVVTNKGALLALFHEFANHDNPPVITPPARMYELLVRFRIDALCSQRELEALLRGQDGGVSFVGFVDALRAIADASLQHLSPTDGDVRLAMLLHLMEPSSFFDLHNLHLSRKKNLDRRRIIEGAGGPRTRATSATTTTSTAKFLVEIASGIGMTTDDDTEVSP